MTRQHVEDFCRATSELQQGRLKLAQSNKPLLCDRRKLRDELMDALPDGVTVRAGSAGYTKKKRTTYKSLTETRIREALHETLQQPSHENSEGLITATLAILHASRKNPETFHLVRSRSSTSSSSLPAIVRQKAEALAQIEETLRERRATFSLATMELRDRVNATKPRVLNFLKKSRSGPVTKNITLSAGGGFSEAYKLRTVYKRKPITNVRLKQAIGACYGKLSESADAFVDAVLEQLRSEGSTLELRLSHRRVVATPAHMRV